jgi:hypothetical protein
MPSFKHGIRHGSPPTISSCQPVSQIGRAMTRWRALAGYERKYRFDEPVPAFNLLDLRVQSLQGGIVPQAPS